MASAGKSTFRFVIHHHIRSGDSHWDLMLEKSDEDVLMTWRVEEGFKGAKALRIFDHPMRFLDYEGPVENGSAQVKMVDKGEYSVFEESKGRLGVLLKGESIGGSFVLERQSGETWSIRERK
jgi:hypothetical protein